MDQSGTIGCSDVFSRNHHVGVFVRRILFHERMQVSQAFKLISPDLIFTNAELSLFQIACLNHSLDTVDRYY